MVDFTCRLVAFHPDNRVTGPWGVSISSKPEIVVTDRCNVDLTQIRGWIECPDKETALEIIRRLEAR